MFDRSEINVWRERRTLQRNFSEAVRLLGSNRLSRMLHAEIPLEVREHLTVLKDAECRTVGELVQSIGESSLAELFHFQLSAETGLFEIVME